VTTGAPVNVADEFEAALRERSATQYVLRLYVTGMTPRSASAIENLKQVCEQYLEGRYTLEVIDIYQHPKLARDEQIIAAPTLIKELLFRCAVYRDLSDREKYCSD
jgi:circadian clock protein KaiB